MKESAHQDRAVPFQSKRASLTERDEQLIWHPLSQPAVEGRARGIIRGQGAVLFGEDGSEYLDAISSWWVNLHGHGHPLFAERISEQAAQIAQVIFSGFTHRAAIELCESLAPLVPLSSPFFFFSDNGSTAVEVALKMVIQYWHNRGDRKRTRIVALENSYHGETLGALAAGSRGVYSTPFSQYLFDVTYLRPPYPFEETGGSGADEWRAALDDNAAVFIYEPRLQCAGGMRIYEVEWLEGVLSWCKERSIPTVADEVATGFRRTGPLFASDSIRTKPDILCLSKGLTGGILPLGLTIAEKWIHGEFISRDRSRMFLHSHSFTGNALSCAAASASLELLMADECFERVERLSILQAEFAKRIGDSPFALRPRALGTVLAFEVKVSGGHTYYNPVREVLYPFFLERGVLLRPLGTTVYILPPYCTTDGQMERIYEVIEEALATIVPDFNED